MSRSTIDGFHKTYLENKILSACRHVTTQSTRSDTLFPDRVDFPSRHIGPRDQDIVTMLDLLGYKVSLVTHYDTKLFK